MSFTSQPVELVLEQLSYLPIEDLNALLRTNKYIRSMIQKHKNLFCRFQLIRYGFRVPRQMTGCCPIFVEIEPYIPLSPEGVKHVESYYPTRQAALNALFQACADDNLIRSVSFLLGQGAEINSDDCYALRESIAEKQTEMVRFLLEHGARVYDDMLLDAAYERDNHAIIRLLAQHGARVNMLNQDDQNFLRGSAPFLFN